MYYGVSEGKPQICYCYMSRNIYIDFIVILKCVAIIKISPVAAYNMRFVTRQLNISVRTDKCSKFHFIIFSFCYDFLLLSIYNLTV